PPPSPVVGGGSAAPAAAMATDPPPSPVAAPVVELPAPSTPLSEAAASATATMLVVGFCVVPENVVELEPPGSVPMLCSWPLFSQLATTIVCPDPLGAAFVALDPATMPTTRSSSGVVSVTECEPEPPSAKSESRMGSSRSTPSTNTIETVGPPSGHWSVHAHCADTVPDSSET